MDFAANFTAIDFETASRRADSACQFAAVVVREGEIAEQAMWMIRPEPFHFSRFNIGIHGITPQQVRDEPVFGDLWPEIAEKLGDDCLVAHNASFDIGVLLACLRSHRQSIPEIQFTCTRAIARRTWTHQRRYGLKPLSNWLGIRFQHHDALEDSIACAKILLAAGIDRRAKSLEDLEKGLKLSRGKAGSWGQKAPRRRGVRRGEQKTRAASLSGQVPFLVPRSADASDSVLRDQAGVESSIDLQRIMVRADFIRPWSGMRVVLTGRFRHLSRQEAEALAIRLGGICQAAVDETTDFLVVGDKPVHGSAAPAEFERGKARDLQAGGKAIQIVGENDFLGLVTSPIGDAPRDS